MTISVFDWRDAIQKSNLKPTTRHVLLNLSTWMRPGIDNCYPSLTLQEKTTGLSRRAIITNIQLAEDAGFLVKRQKHMQNSQWKQSVYYAVFPKIFSLVSAEDYPEENTGAANALVESSTGEPNDVLLVQEVHTKTPRNSPEDIDKKINKKNATSRPCTIAEWEARRGHPLQTNSISEWIETKGLDVAIIRDLIEEFRVEMGGKGKKYVDFKLAFMTYLTKGYLSKPLEQCKRRNTQASQGGEVRTRTRGVSI